jgi:GTP-binding protein EngB required for normal cell division
MTNELHEKLKNRKFVNGFKPQEEKILFTIEGKNIGTSQSFVTFQGLPKAGKSTFITSIIASAYTTWDIFNCKLNFPKDRKRLCYIDTESSDYDYYRVLERIRQQIITDLLPHNFDSFLFREDNANDIKQMIEQYLEENKDCSIIVIDGVLDLIANFNDVEQSFYLVQWLKKITKKYDLLVLLVLHLGKKDQNSIGHIGSYLDRKSQSVLRIEKNKQNNTLDLTAQFLRSTEDFNPISIQYQGGNWNQVNNDMPVNNQLIYGIDRKRLLHQVLLEPKSYNQLVNDLAEVTGKGVSTIKKLVKQLIIEQAIVKYNELYKIK